MVDKILLAQATSTAELPPTPKNVVAPAPVPAAPASPVPAAPAGGLDPLPPATETLPPSLTPFKIDACLAYLQSVGHAPLGATGVSEDRRADYANRGVEACKLKPGSIGEPLPPAAEPLPPGNEEEKDPCLQSFERAGQAPGGATSVPEHIRKHSCPTSPAPSETAPTAK
jgi:hypothetical protein